MQGFEIRFNVYADSQQEADLASSAIKKFIGELAGRGIAVTANRITAAANKYKDSYFVSNYFKQ